MAAHCHDYGEAGTVWIPLKEYLAGKWVSTTSTACEWHDTDTYDPDSELEPKPKPERRENPYGHPPGRKHKQTADKSAKRHAAKAKVKAWKAHMRRTGCGAYIKGTRKKEI